MDFSDIRHHNCHPVSVKYKGYLNIPKLNNERSYCGSTLIFTDLYSPFATARVDPRIGCNNYPVIRQWLILRNIYDIRKFFDACKILIKMTVTDIHLF